MRRSRTICAAGFLRTRLSSCGSDARRIFSRGHLPVDGKRTWKACLSLGWRSVGSYALQIAKLPGAKPVVAGASAQAKRDHALQAGADYAIDYTQLEWSEEVRAITDGNGLDVVLDMSGGGEAFKRSLATLANVGRIVVYGSAGARAALSSASALPRLVRAHSELQDTRIIFFTALISQQESPDTIVMRGGDMFVAKPIQLTKLIGCIDAVLNGNSDRVAVFAPSLPKY